jgi:hypothetical protein
LVVDGIVDEKQSGVIVDQSLMIGERSASDRRAIGGTSDLPPITSERQKSEVIGGKTKFSHFFSICPRLCPIGQIGDEIVDPSGQWQPLLKKTVASLQMLRGR